MLAHRALLISFAVAAWWKNVKLKKRLYSGNAAAFNRNVINIGSNQIADVPELPENPEKHIFPEMKPSWIDFSRWSYRWFEICIFFCVFVIMCKKKVITYLCKMVAHLKSLILLCKNFLIFQGKSLCPSISGVSCSSRSASLSLSCKGAPRGARSARGPATHAVPATSTRIATQHQRRCHTEKPELRLINNNNSQHSQS